VTFHGLVACCQKRLKWHQVLQLRAAMEQGAISRGRAPWGVETRTNMKNQWTNGFIASMKHQDWGTLEIGTSLGVSKNTCGTQNLPWDGGKCLLEISFGKLWRSGPMVVTCGDSSFLYL
jgi:hypothetical protein